MQKKFLRLPLHFLLIKLSLVRRIALFPRSNLKTNFLNPFPISNGFSQSEYIYENSFLALMKMLDPSLCPALAVTFFLIIDS